MLLLLAAQLATLTAWSREEYYPRLLGKVAQKTELARLAQLVQAADGSVLADEYMGLVPLAGRRLYFQPFEYKQLAEAGLWDDDRLVGVIDRQEFPLLLLYEPPDWDAFYSRWSEPLRRAIYRRYTRGEVWAYTVVYRPKP